MNDRSDIEKAFDKWATGRNLPLSLFDAFSAGAALSSLDSLVVRPVPAEQTVPMEISAEVLSALDGRLSAYYHGRPYKKRDDLRTILREELSPQYSQPTNLDYQRAEAIIHKARGLNPIGTDALAGLLVSFRTEFSKSCEKSALDEQDVGLARQLATEWVNAIEGSWKIGQINYITHQLSALLASRSQHEVPNNLPAASAYIKQLETALAKLYPDGTSFTDILNGKPKTSKDFYKACDFCEGCEHEFLHTKAPKDARELLEHCASLAVAYMQDVDRWDGSVSDCGYLRDAIVNGDHSGFIYSEGEQPEWSKDAREIAERILNQTGGFIEPWARYAASDIERYVQARFASARSQEVSDFRMDELDAVMCSVDKWFDEGDTRLQQNPQNRSADAREIALQAIERQEARAELAEYKVEKMRTELMNLIEIIRMNYHEDRDKIDGCEKSECEICEAIRQAEINITL